MIRASAMLGLLIILLGCTSSVMAGGPIHDPFLEEFRLGWYADPGDRELVAGFPAALWRPALVDTAWIRTALAVMASEADHRSDGPASLLATWQRGPQQPGRMVSWWQSRKAILQGFLGQEPAPAPDTQGVLGRAWLTRKFFAALADGDSLAGLDVARSLVVASDDPDVEPDVEPDFTFVWDLRRRALAAAMGAEPDPLDPWPLLFSLGPFDRNSGWAIWVAHRRQLGLPLLTVRHETGEQAQDLAGMNRCWLGTSDILGSGFDYETKAGLGAVVLEGEERRAFMARYEHPPWSFTPQGWWVRGARMAARGQADAYEKMAGDEHLRSGWRMDLWRRASERRLLQGQWTQGLADLKRAVGLASYGAGSPGLRRRVREWTSQALALAVATGEAVHARWIADLGGTDLPEPERGAFTGRTAVWYGDSAKKSGSESASEPPSVLAGLAESLGGKNAGPVLPSGSTLRLADWQGWARAAGPAHEPPAGTAWDSLSRATDPEIARGLAVALLARMGAGLDIPFSLWDGILLHEVYLGGGGGNSAPGSLAGAVKDELKQRNSAGPFWLGVALALQDLRTVFTLVTLGTGDDLKSADRQRFLYPVPSFGPVRRALEDADSPPDLLLAVARNESLFDPGARSRAGALGWLQIMPFHYSGEELASGAVWSDPAVSIGKGDALLQENIRRYHGDPYRVLAAYNAGPRAADRWDDQLGGAAERSLYLAWIGYTETRGYVEKVLMDRNIYAAILAPQQRANDRAE